MSLRPFCADGLHQIEFLSMRHQYQVVDLKNFNCERPDRWICKVCDFKALKKCEAIREEDCRPCALQRKRDVKQSLRSGLMKNMNWVEMTITLAGVDKFPWDKSKCDHLKSVDCSGLIGCRTDEWASAVANTELPKEFNRFIQDVRRLFGVNIQYAKVFEAQTRGLLHLHMLMIDCPPWHMKRIRKELMRLVLKRGLGVQGKIKRVVGDSPKDIQRAVAYCAKYLTKGSKQLQTINKKTGEIKLGGYRDFTQSREFGDSLKYVRSHRIDFYRLAQSVEQAKDADAREAGAATSLGDVVALDYLYKESYTLIE